MAGAATKPFSRVRGPTVSLIENESPGCTTVPSIRSAMRWMFSTRGSQQE
jgi:hypothetical protein